MARPRLYDVVDRFYPWPVKAAIVSAPGGLRLHIWYFDESQLIKNDALMPWHQEPWRLLREKHADRAKRIERKIDEASLVPAAITDALQMLRSWYPTPPDPRALCGPPGMAGAFDAKAAREVEAVALSDVALVLVRLMACLDRGSEHEPITIEDVAAILQAHPDVRPRLYGSSREARNDDHAAIVRWLRKKMTRFRQHSGVSADYYRRELLRQPDLLAELCGVGVHGERWMNTLAPSERHLVEGLRKGRALSSSCEGALVRSLEAFLNEVA
jgi:hypothetical protein